MVDTNGSIKLCCVAEDPITPNKFGDTKSAGQEMTVNKQSLGSAWNSEYMLSVRERLVKGQQVQDCGQCYRKERNGEYSFRQRANEHWADETKQVLDQYNSYDIEYEKANDFEKEKMQMTKYMVEDMPVYLDIRFGNLCNLKCRMCTGLYSKKFGEELESIANTDEKFRMLAPDSAKVYNFDWYDNPNFWKELEQYMPHIKLLYLTGGEPTLVQGNYDFLQQLIDKGYAKNIGLVFNTNVTNFQDRFLNIISKFRHVCLNLSIDGIGGVQEYIRYPSKWKAIVKNMNMLMDKIKSTNTKFDLVFTPTISILNVGSFHELIDWCYNFSNANPSDKIYWDMVPIFLHGPQFQDMIHASHDLRQFAINNLESVEQKQIDHFANLKSFYDEVIFTLKERFEDEIEAQNFRKQLFKWNYSIDKNRGINITNYIPYSKLIYG